MEKAFTVMVVHACMHIRVTKSIISEYKFKQSACMLSIPRNECINACNIRETTLEEEDAIVDGEKGGWTHLGQADSTGLIGVDAQEVEWEAVPYEPLADAVLVLGSVYSRESSRKNRDIERGA